MESLPFTDVLYPSFKTGIYSQKLASVTLVLMTAWDSLTNILELWFSFSSDSSFSPVSLTQ